MNKDLNRPLEPILGIALYGLFWPVFNAVAVGVLSELGYELKLGGGLLWMLFSALSLLMGVLFLVIFLVGLRKPHPPLPLNTVAGWTLVAILASSACLNASWLRGDYFCQSGACPSMN
ncbi:MULTISPECIES: hypothetical protein [unclassified Janthinobacterium]|uniref:hypothetical protein n=1 Tax=unclassified Janthinobacterium TaxID=2610881 RepID=UPI000344EC9F|nr:MULTISPECIES: hypothetical protein [unclassified Janthinobacterium]MEC5159377.1 hypothetical protein [Janthinobacterium sp. CG_S6]